MVDPRIYRAGLGILLFAVVVFAFSLQPSPAPVGTTVAPGPAFGSAYGTMMSLYRRFPDRPPGSPSDDRLAEAVAAGLSQPAGSFTVSTRTDIVRTQTGTQAVQTVTATRSALGTGAIVVVAPRDGSGPAALSGTAVLLELARALGGATLSRPVMLVSTSGSVGAAGVRALIPTLQSQPIDAVITLDDLAGARLDRPVIVPWGTGAALTPPVLRATLSAFAASQGGVPGGSVGVVGQLAHEMLPFAVGEQAPLLAAGIPAVGVSTAGPRPVPAHEPLSRSRITGLGGAVLQSVEALEAAPDVPAPTAYLTVNGQLVPLWAVRLLTLALILPVAATVVDALARTRRRGHPLLSWLGWILVGAVPFLLAAGIVLLAGLTGALAAAPPGPVAGSVPLTLRGGAVIALAALGFLAAVYARPWLLRRVTGSGAVRRPPQTPAVDGAAVALCVFGCALGLILWAVNPFASLLLVPALHAWLWLADEAVRGRRIMVLWLALVSVSPILGVAGYYMWSLGLSPLGLLWSDVLWVAGRGFTPAGDLLAVLIGAGFLSAFVLSFRALRLSPEGDPVVTVRGPASYAGPGSLGGTESALRR